jgi:predicted GNAT family acetyltransferase
VLPNQPFLVTKSLYGVDFDWSVRRVRPSELPNYLPAAIAMFTEELGVSPMSNGSGAGFRARVAELIHAGRAFARFGPRGQVEFKAEIGGLSCDTAQIQGVWVRPELRGRGMGTGAVGAVLDYALDSAPSASLYVNHFNEPARRMYQRLGMRQTRTLATVLF